MKKILEYLFVAFAIAVIFVISLVVYALYY